MSLESNTTHSEWTPERQAAATRNVLFILAGGIVLGIFATAANLYYVAACIAAALMVTLVAWQFEAALLVYVLVAFIPWGETPDLAVGGSGVGKGVFVSEIMLGFLLVIWWGKYLLQALPRNRPRSGFHIPILLYIAYSVLNVAHSFIFWDPHVNKIYQHPAVNVIELGLRILSGGAFILLATSVSSGKWLKWITVFLLLPGFYCLFNGAIGNRIPVSSPWWPLLSIFPVCYLWTITLDATAKPFARLAAGAVVATAAYVIVVRDISWVSGWLGLLTALGAVTLFKSRRLFAAGVVVALVLAIAFWPFVQKNVFMASADEGDYDRFALLAGSWRYATTFPLGVGIGNYRTYNSFHYGQAWGTTAYTSAHGTYAQQLSEMGIPGFVLFVSILVSGFLWMARNLVRTRGTPTATYLLAAMGQMVGLASAATIGDYIIPTYHNGGVVTFSTTVYSWLIWGLAVAHVRLHAESSQDVQPPVESELAHSRGGR